ncbi:MAG: hypothetical protein JNL98_41005, partial [Bryobacterales bacterium]|nr:hypothetical protein [Bryobacterales bacterium]
MDVFALVIACLVWWRYSRRANRLEAELLSLRSSLTAADDIIQQLTRRVYALENRPAHHTAPEAIHQPETSVADPVQTDRSEPAGVEPMETLEPVGTMEPVATIEPASPPLPAFPPIDEATQPEPQPEAPPPVLEPPAPPRDWEALIGTSLLNAAGVLVLVIGISLLLGYTLTVMGPLGKVAIGISIGLVM